MSAPLLNQAQFDSPECFLIISERALPEPASLSGSSRLNAITLPLPCLFLTVKGLSTPGGGLPLLSYDPLDDPRPLPIASLGDEQLATV